MQIQSAIGWAQSQFEALSDSPRLDAELLLAFCHDKPRSYLYSWPEKVLEQNIEAEFKQLVARRLKPTPIAYLLGEREFYSISLQTSPVALIPRPETELLVDSARALCEQFKPARVLELGTGSGAISIALKIHQPEIELLTTDVSYDCLQLAQSNAKKNNISLHCLESDWYTNVPKQPKFDLIVSNPPYVAASDPCLKQGDLPAEPMLALSPGESGLEAIEKIIADAGNYLDSGGYLMLEHGSEQSAAVANRLAAAGFLEIENRQDSSQLPRLSLARLP